MVSPFRDLCTYKITNRSLRGGAWETGRSGWRRQVVDGGTGQAGYGDRGRKQRLIGRWQWEFPEAIRSTKRREGWRGSYPLPPVIGHAAADRESVRIHAESGRNPNIDATRSFDLSYRRTACTQGPRQCNENVKNPCREHGGGAHKRVAFVAGGGVSKVSAGKTGGSGKCPDERGRGRYMGAVASYGRPTFVQHE